MFSAKISFVKTSTSIVKYESRVVKSNPGCFYYDSFIMIIFLVDAGTRNILLSDVLVGKKKDLAHFGNYKGRPLQKVF